MLHALVSLLSSGVAFAPPADPTINYVTVVPESQTTFVSGSKPIIRVTLSKNVTLDTVVAVISSNNNKFENTYINIPTGQRVGYVQIPVKNLGSNTSVKATAQVGSSVMDSRSFTCVQATLHHWSFVDVDNSANPVNTVGNSDNFEFKVTLNGPAQPSGLTYDVISVTGPLAARLTGFGSTVTGGASIDRNQFPVFTGTGTGSITVQTSEGTTFTNTYSVI